MRGAAKEIALMGIMIALLVGGQLALSFVAGVEIVTVLLAAYAAAFGVRRGMIVAAGFSLVRCLVFGFAATAVILYLAYYPAFAAAFGALGRAKRANLFAFCLLAVVLTPLFTLADDLITPLVMGMRGVRWRMYVYYSLPVMGVQTLCAAVTLSVGFMPLYRAFCAFSGRGQGEKSI